MRRCCAGGAGHAGPAGTGDPQVHHRPPAKRHSISALQSVSSHQSGRPVCCPPPVPARSSEALSPSTPGTLPAPLSSPTPRRSVSKKAFPVSREATYRHPGRFPGVSRWEPSLRATEGQFSQVQPCLMSWPDPLTLPCMYIILELKPEQSILGPLHAKALSL